MCNDNIFIIVLDTHFPLIMEQFQKYAAAAQDSADLQTPETLVALDQETQKLDAAHAAYRQAFVTVGGTEKEGTAMFNRRAEEYQAGRHINRFMP